MVIAGLIKLLRGSIFEFCVLSGSEVFQSKDLLGTEESRSVKLHLCCVLSCEFKLVQRIG